MGQDILIVKKPAKPYWENEEWVEFGSVSPKEWESLFFKEFNVKTIFEYVRKNGDAKNYENYYLRKINHLQDSYPLIFRIKDNYKDAIFLVNEINELIKEIRSMLGIVKNEDAKSFLNQLLSAAKKASENNAGIQLIAD